MLNYLNISKTKIDDDGLAMLVNSLRKNTSLTTLLLRGNDGISEPGRIMLLKLVNDISSIKATLQSNHTLTSFKVRVEEDEIERQIAIATKINRMEHNLEAAGIERR